MKQWIRAVLLGLSLPLVMAVPGGGGGDDPDPKPEPNDDPEPDPKPDQEPTPEVVDKSKFDSVLSESIGRKKKLSAAERRIEELEKKLEGADSAKEIEDLKGKLQGEQERATRLEYQGLIKDLVAADAVDGDVVGIIYDKAKAGEKLEPELIEGFVKEFRENHPGFFKQTTESPGARPAGDERIRRPGDPSTIAPEGDLKAWLAMSQEERDAEEDKRPGTKRRMEKAKIKAIREGLKTQPVVQHATEG